MADVESISHSGIIAPDTRAAHEFYKDVLGGSTLETVSRSYEGGRGGSAHPAGTVADYLFVTFPRARDFSPTDDASHGVPSYRHAFAVSRERFDEALTWLKAHDVPFEGPVSHPEHGPLGDSVYFRDPGGNFFELCWRRDEGGRHNSVIMASG